MFLKKIYEEKPESQSERNPFRHRLFSYKNEIYSLGGEFSKLFLSKFNPKESEWKIIDLEDFGDEIDSLQDHSCVVYENKLFIIGGIMNDFSFFNEKIIEINLDTFSNKSYKSKISKRYLHTSVLYNDVIYAFGGFDEMQSLNDLYKIQIMQDKIKIEEIDYQGEIISRFNHTSVIYGDCMYVYAGFTVSNYSGNLNDLHEYNLKTNTWREIELKGEIPKGRWGHQSVVFNNQMIMYGGSDDPNSISLDDLYIFNMINFQWEKYQGKTPPPRWGHQSIILKGSLFIYGGIRKFGCSPFNNIYEYQLEIYTDFNQRLLEKVNKYQLCDVFIIV